MSRVGRAMSFGRAIAAEAKAENVTFMAGSIAYQAFVSLLPLLILVFFVVSAVGDESLASDVTEFTRSFLPPNARQLLANAISGNAGSAGASAIGLVTLLWGTLKIFRGLDTAFSEIYDTDARNSIVDKLTDGIVVFVALALAIIAAGVAGSTFAAFSAVPFIGLLNPLFLIAGLIVAFTPMYYLFPDEDLSLRDVLPGVIVAAVGWTALEALFQVYVSFADKSDVYGVVGAVILLLTWLYFGGLVLLLGATVNAVIAGRATTTTAIEATADMETVDTDADVDRGRSERFVEARSDAIPRACVGSTLGRDEFARYLGEVRTGLGGTGAATVRAGNEPLVLHPPTEGIEYDITVFERSADDHDAGTTPEPNDREARSDGENPMEGFVLEARWVPSDRWASRTASTADERESPPS